MFTYHRRTIITLCLALVLATASAPRFVLAASLTGLSDTPSSTVAQATGVTHTVSFTTATSDTLKRIEVRFSTTSGGTTRPAALDLSSATLGTLTGLASAWTLNTGSAANGVVFIELAAGESVSNGTSITLPLQGITNSADSDCQPLETTLADTCYVKVTTYNDAGITAVDNGETTYTVVANASLTFQVEGTSAGEVHNGITTTKASTPTTLPFGQLLPGQVSYVTHKITITSNAPNGYTVYAVLTDLIQGETSHVTISPFGATNATWTTPQNWGTPTGSTQGSNTGWFGANTTDTSVTGWSGSTSQKFGPLGTTRRPVATVAAGVTGSKVVYITYGLGVNQAQPSDSYTGTVMYEVEPSY